MIELQHISKWYNVGGKPTFILKDINLKIKEGEFVSIMGPSGSGKTTLLNIIGMLDMPSEGGYQFLDQSVYDLKEKQRTELYKKNIGFIFQAYHLIDELTVYENIETPLLYQNVKSSERKAIVSDMLDKFNIVGQKRPLSQPAIRRATATGGHCAGPHCQTQSYCWPMNQPATSIPNKAKKLWSCSRK